MYHVFSAFYLKKKKNKQKKKTEIHIFSEIALKWDIFCEQMGI